jgi:hypothetical protein
MLGLNHTSVAVVVKDYKERLIKGEDVNLLTPVIIVFVLFLYFSYFLRAASEALQRF